MHKYLLGWKVHSSLVDLLQQNKTCSHLHAMKNMNEKNFNVTYYAYNIKKLKNDRKFRSFLNDGWQGCRDTYTPFHCLILHFFFSLCFLDLCIVLIQVVTDVFQRAIKKMNYGGRKKSELSKLYDICCNYSL